MSNFRNTLTDEHRRESFDNFCKLSDQEQRFLIFDAVQVSTGNTIVLERKLNWLDDKINLIGKKLGLVKEEDDGKVKIIKPKPGIIGKA